MNCKTFAAGLALLAATGAAHAQMQTNSTPTGAAVPSGQQTTGKAADAHGRDQPQPNGNVNSGSDHGHSHDKASPSPNAAPTK